MTLETRTQTSPLEFRAGDTGKVLSGIAIVYNSETRIGDFFRERILPGAFATSLKGDVRALFNHDSSIVLGRTTAKTLRLKDQANALSFEVDLPDTQAGRDLAVSVQRGDIAGTSFGFRVTKQEWDETGDIPLRSVIEAELFEISPCGDPAYEDTSLALRSLDEARKEGKRKNFTAASERLRMKADLDLRTRGARE
jgi:uncharacterized protein